MVAITWKDGRPPAATAMRSTSAAISDSIIPGRAIRIAAVCISTEVSTALSSSQNWTNVSIIVVGVMVVFIGLALSWLIGRSITKPLNGLATVMTRLADGDTSTNIPATEANDEIGTMARTVIVFRDKMVERERLAQTQAEANRSRENRSEIIAKMIAHFEKSVNAALGKLRGAA